MNKEEAIRKRDEYEYLKTKKLVNSQLIPISVKSLYIAPTKSEVAESKKWLMNQDAMVANYKSEDLSVFIEYGIVNDPVVWRTFLTQFLKEYPH